MEAGIRSKLHREGNMLTSALLIFLNLFFITTSFYIIKAVRGALVVSELGAKSLPVLWILSAIGISIFVLVYGWVIERFSFKKVVSAITLVFLFALALIRYGLPTGSVPFTVLLYIWGDLFSVMMVEQFWSFANHVFDSRGAKRWYGMVGSGGILGGVAGSALAANLALPLGSYQLISVCVGILILQNVVILALETNLERGGEGSNWREVVERKWFGRKTTRKSHWRELLSNHYVLSILTCVVLTQIISSLIDFQFNTFVELSVGTVDSKTQFFGNFFLWMNVVSLLMMLLFNRAVQSRYVGIRGALTVLPITNFASLLIFLLFPMPIVMFAMKLLDKSLSYSIHRASKELLYIPTSWSIRFKAKAFIDMFAHRVSGLLSSLLLIPFISFLSLSQINILGMLIIVFLIHFIRKLTLNYETLIHSKAPLSPMAGKEELDGVPSLPLQ